MSKNRVKNVNKIALKYLPLYIVGLFFLIVSQYLSSLISIFIGQAMSIFSGEKDIFIPTFLQRFYNSSSTYNSIKSLCIIFIIVGIVMVIFRYFRTVFRRLYYLELETNVSRTFFGHSIRMSKSFISKNSTGDLIQRGIQDSHRYSKFIGMDLFRFMYYLASISTVLFNIFMLSRINFLISFFIVILIISFQLFYSVKILRKKEQKLSEMKSKMDSVNQQTFTNIMMVKTFAGEEKELEKLKNINYKTNQMQYDVEMIYVRYWAIFDFFSVFYKAVMLFVVGLLFIKGNIGFGVATSLILLNGEVMSNVNDIMGKINKAIKNSVACKRLNEYLKVEDDFYIDGELKPEIDGSIKIENLSVKIDDKYVLKNINLDVKSGQTIGVIGKSGSGKSTLMNALTRLNDGYEGSVKLSGIELDEINKHYLRENIGIINQDSFVFSTTVKDNISIIKDDATDTQIQDITKKVCFDDDILKFKQGYETIVGERGVTLSGGQKQRISIARTLLKDSKILFLDDCLSALDNNVAKQIKTNIKDTNKTCFIISHNLLNVIDADKIIVLENGEILEEGTHSELVNLNGVYSKIWTLQQQIKEDTDDEKE